MVTQWGHTMTAGSRHTQNTPTDYFFYTSKTAFSSAKLSEKSSDSDVVFDCTVCSDIFTSNCERTELLISSIFQRF